MQDVGYAFKAKFSQKLIYLRSLKQADCLLIVHPGNFHQTAEKFQATVELINQHFASCTIVIADLLQRHHYLITHDFCDTKATMLALQAGEQWLNLQHDTLRAFTIPHTVQLWQTWLYDLRYAVQREVIELLFATDAHVRHALLTTAHSLFTRYSQRHRDCLINATQVKSLMLEYIKEECSMLPLWTHEQFHFQIGTTSRTPAQHAIYNCLVQPEYPQYLRYLQISLHNSTTMNECQSTIPLHFQQKSIVTH